MEDKKKEYNTYTWKWSYLHQKLEYKRGYDNGKTYVWEVDEKFREELNAGEQFKYKGFCKNDQTNHTGERAPWLEVAFEEFKMFKGLIEEESPLKERISEYFVLTGNSNLDYKAPWCAAFIRWCFSKTEYENTNTKGTAAAFSWGLYKNIKVADNKYVEGWKNGMECEPFVGAIVVFLFSHVAIIIGENLDGDRYVYLGGNQNRYKEDSSGKQEIILGSIKKDSDQIFYIMKPKKYEVKENEKKLPKYDISRENNKETTR